MLSLPKVRDASSSSSTGGGSRPWLSSAEESKVGGHSMSLHVEPRLGGAGSKQRTALQGRLDSMDASVGGMSFGHRQSIDSSTMGTDFTPSGLITGNKQMFPDLGTSLHQRPGGGGGPGTRKSDTSVATSVESEAGTPSNGASKPSNGASKLLVSSPKKGKTRRGFKQHHGRAAYDTSGVSSRSSRPTYSHHTGSFEMLHQASLATSSSQQGAPTRNRMQVPPPKG